MATLNLKASKIYSKNRESFLDPNKKVIVNEGGTGSSKTYSILQFLITLCFERTGLQIDIIRETLPALRKSVLIDFKMILSVYGLWNENDFNKTEGIYSFRGNQFWFYSCEDGQKIRGRRRDIVYLNEANEISYDTYLQIILRTNEKMFLDYNPSEEEHWIYDTVVSREDCAFIHSTYLDNPFLQQSVKEEIERLETDDPEYWKIYGLGLRGKRTGLIYPNYEIVPEFPDCEDVLYGLDFGFNDPKVVVKLGRIGQDIYIDELLYKRGMIREDFVKELKALIPEDQRTKEQYADSADPESIEVIYRAGFNIHPADKEKDSVMFGIETVRGYRLHITARSINVLKDFKNYKWKVDKNGKTLDEPIHAFSHAPDAVRYPVYTHWGKEYRNLTSKDTQDVEIEQMESVSIAENW